MLSELLSLIEWAEVDFRKRKMIAGIKSLINNLCFSDVFL